ncbi:MAG: CoA transferase, partial [Spongiibacteraceae bacterium]
MLADLGADVVLVEPPAGAATRSQQPLVAGVSLYFSTHNANKRSVVLDLNSEEGRSQFLRLADAADILIETTRPGTLDDLGLAVASLHQRNPQLVVLSISDFGQTGPYRDYVATNAVQMAMAGSLCRSGLPGAHDPVLPPGQLAYESAAMQAAWGLIAAYWQRLHTGVGDHLDFSMFEGTTQILDPLLGATGSAAAGQSQMQLAATRGRPDAGHMYPIFKCRDGYVRMCILNPRQWHGMRDWLAFAADHEFMDPAFDSVFKRMQNAKRINSLIAELMSSVSKKEAVVGGQRRGVPVAA